MAEVLGLEVKSMTFEETAAKLKPFFAMFQILENRASNKKAVEQFGWQPKEVGILEDIRKGSYLAVAEELRKTKSA